MTRERLSIDIYTKKAMMIGTMTTAITSQNIELELDDIRQVSISENTSFNTLIYFQPDIKDFSEIRSLLRLGLKVRATNSFFININYEYVHDSSPPIDTDKKNSKYGFKITYEF